MLKATGNKDSTSLWSTPLEVVAALYTQLDRLETTWIWFQSQPLNFRSYSALPVGAWCHVFLVTVPVMTRSPRSIWNVIDVLALDLQNVPEPHGCGRPVKGGVLYQANQQNIPDVRINKAVICIGIKRNFSQKSNRLQPGQWCSCRFRECVQ